MLGIERILQRRFQRLVVSGQRSVFESAGDPNPSHAIWMHDERLITRDCVIALCILRGSVAWRLVFFEIRRIVADPLLLLRIPPDQLLALTPRPAIGACRRAVIEDASVGG